MASVTRVCMEIGEEAVLCRQWKAHLSWPIVSPEPSDLDQPEEEDCSSFSQASSSSAAMFTSSLNSLTVG